MMSLDASGTLAGAITFAKWKGRNYVRERVIPSNPRSGGQTGMRAMMKFLSQQWAGLSAPNKATWETIADANNYSPFNAYTSRNAKAWRNFTSPTKATPAAAAGTESTSGVHTATAGERSITLAVKCTSADDGWGVAIFRSTSTGFTPGWDNLIACVAIDGTNDVPYVDTPLDPDTWYYNFRPFTIDGVFSVADGEIDATVA